jgi:hypothetical protein
MVSRLNVPMGLRANGVNLMVSSTNGQQPRYTRRQKTVRVPVDNPKKEKEIEI